MGICPSADKVNVGLPAAGRSKTAEMYSLSRFIGVSQPMNLRACVRRSYILVHHHIIVFFSNFFKYYFKS